MRWLIYRVNIAYWLRRLAGFSALEAWKYSKEFKEYFDLDEMIAKDQVEEELSYWSE